MEYIDFLYWQIGRPLFWRETFALWTYNLRDKYFDTFPGDYCEGAD